MRPAGAPQDDEVLCAELQSSVILRSPRSGRLEGRPLASLALRMRRCDKCHPQHSSSWAAPRRSRGACRRTRYAHAAEWRIALRLSGLRL